MKIVIIGASQAGVQIARDLIREKSAVTFLEREEAVIRSLTERLDCKVIHGDGTNINDLEQAGIATADFVLVVTQSDEVNLTCCYVITHHFPHVKTVMRLRNIGPETALVIQKTMGSGCLVVNPVQETANSIFEIIQVGGSGSFYRFFDGRIQLIGTTIDEVHPFAERSLAELRVASEVPFLIPFVRRQGRLTVPSGQTKILAGDVVYIAIKKEDTQKFFNFGRKKSRRRVVILGGNDISVAVAKLLAAQNQNVLARIAQRIFGDGQHHAYNIKIVERDFDRCRKIKDVLPDVQILNVDITDEDVFQEEALDKADIFIAVTDNSELNIVTALYFKQIGVGRAIVAVRNRNFFNLASKLNLDTLIGTGNSLANAVLSHLHGREVRRILSVTDGSEIDMLEIELADQSPALGKTIKELKLPEQTLISFIYRNETAIIPDGTVALQRGDRLVVITSHELLEQSRLVFSKALP